MLAQRFGASMTVIREALTRLTEQGLVVSSPHRGFSVMALSGEDLRDLTVMRVRLEGQALRDSIELGALEWATRTVASHFAMDRTPTFRGDGTVNPEWQQCHRAFHHALISGCGSPRLIAIAAALRDSADIYRAWGRSLARDTRRDVAREHGEIMTFALDGDADGAVQALTAHIERTAVVLLKYAETAQSE